MKKINTGMLTEGGILLALAVILNQIIVMRMPQGGSISLGGMVPILLFAMRWGVGPGIFAGAIFGVLDFILAPSFFTIAQVILDYPIAYGALGLAGLAHKKEGIPSIGKTATFSILGIIGRLIAAVISGYVFFGSYAPTGVNPLWYSITYNISYLLPDAAIALIILTLVYQPVMRAMPKGSAA